MSRGEGSAPLTITFSNLSRNASQFQWDFGDGSTSTEKSPQHIYTKVGVFAVTLRALLNTSGGVLEDHSTQQITVRPGPLARLVINPTTITLKPAETQTFSVEGFDAIGNRISPLDLIWSAHALAGSISPDGTFRAGTTAGQYPDSITLLASAGGARKGVTASVTIIPGPIAQAIVTASDSTIFTGDEAQLSVQATDRYGNQVSSLNVAWNAEQGQIDSSGNYKAGRDPGQFNISALVSDGQADIESALAISVEQGYCTTTEQTTTWDAQWFSLNDDGSLGQQLGTTTYQGNFLIDRGYGDVFAGRTDKIRLFAHSSIVVQRQGPVKFTVGGDDGYRLFLDGTEILSDWSNHSYRSGTVLLDLNPGIYELSLDYYEWTGNARLTFETDLDVVSWTEAIDCYGGYVQTLSGERYFTLAPEQQSAAELAERFGIEATSIPIRIVNGAQQALIPGDRHNQHRYVIYVHGRSSSSTCEPESDADNALQAAHRLMTHELQTLEGQVPGEIDSDQVIMFSYSGVYAECETGFGYSTQDHPLTSTVIPFYLSTDTCAGVQDAAVKLEELLETIVGRDPQASFDLLGHSLGGLVIAYLAATNPPEGVISRVNSFVTLDSPLLGIGVAQLLTGACTETSTTNMDLAGQTPVVETIGLLSNRPDILPKFMSLIASGGIGSSVPGMTTVVVPVSCQSILTETGAALGFIAGLFIPLGPIILALTGAGLGSIGEAHECAPFDQNALQIVAQFISEDRVNNTPQ